MSCEMKIAAAPVEAPMSSSSFRICCWTVTSRAVVGSSAMISRGVPIRPIAIMTRCRMPPESSYG